MNLVDGSSEILRDISWYFRILFLGGLTFSSVVFFVLAAVQSVVFFYGLSPTLTKSEKVFSAIWLKACSAPLMALVFMPLFSSLLKPISPLLEKVPTALAQAIAYVCLVILFVGVPAVLEIALLRAVVKTRSRSAIHKLFRRDVLTVILANACTAAVFHSIIPFVEAATDFTWNIVGEVCERKYTPDYYDWQKKHPDYN